MTHFLFIQLFILIMFPLILYVFTNHIFICMLAEPFDTLESMTAIERIKEKITYLELNVNQTFMNRFSAAKFLPHTDRSRFPSVNI